MSYDSTASPSSSRSISRPVLPPSLHLTIPQENIDSSDRFGGSKLTIKNFSRAFYHTIFPRQSDMVTRLGRVTEAKVEDENVVRIARTANSINRRTTGRHASPPPTTSIVSQSTASHISTPRSPRTLITSFPPLNVCDVPPRSPTNKSPFSAILLSGEDEEHEEDDDPALALWHTEQLHRARLAKLTRHLGEEIPAELVLSPAFLSHWTSSSPRRGGNHHKCRSLDHSSFTQESHVTRSTEVILRRSKSLKEHGDTHRALSVTGVTPKMPNMENNASGVRDAEITTDIVPIPCPVPPRSTTSPETCYSTSMNIPNSDVLYDEASYSPPHSSRPPVETSSTPSTPSLHASPKSGTLPRRPATADASIRRVEKLANFFGVAHDDLSAVALARGTAQKPQCSSTSAIDIHARESQLEVEVKISKPTRFWSSRVSTKNIHPDDVMDQLRMMKAS